MGGVSTVTISYIPPGGGNEHIFREISGQKYQNERHRVREKGLKIKIRFLRKLNPVPIYRLRYQSGQEVDLTLPCNLFSIFIFVIEKRRLSSMLAQCCLRAGNAYSYQLSPTQSNPTDVVVVIAIVTAPVLSFSFSFSFRFLQSSPQEAPGTSAPSAPQSSEARLRRRRRRRRRYQR